MRSKGGQGGRPLVAAAPATILLAAALLASAAPGLSGQSALPLAAGEDLVLLSYDGRGTFAESLGTAIEEALDAAGFRRRVEASPAGPPAAWAAEASLLEVEGRALVTITMAETGTGARLAAERFSVSAGPTALALMDAAAGRAAARLGAYKAWSEAGKPVDGRFGLFLVLDDRSSTLPTEDLLAGLLAARDLRSVTLGPPAAGTDAAPAEAIRRAAIAAGCRIVGRLGLAGDGADSGLALRLEDALGLVPATVARLPLPAAADHGGEAALRAGIGLAVETFLAAPPPPLSVTVHGPAGMVFSAEGWTAVIPAGGFLALERELPGILAWEAREEGSYPVAGRSEIRTRHTRVTPPRRLWGIELGVYDLSFPELRLSLALGPHGFARAGLTQYPAASALAGYRAAGSPIASVLPLQPGLGLGLSPLPRSSGIRPYLALDAFARLVLPDGRGLAFDPTAPLCLLPSLGIEAGAGPRLRLWAELGSAVYPRAEAARLAASPAGARAGRLLFGSPSLAEGAPGWLVEPILARAGLRLGL